MFSLILLLGVAVTNYYSVAIAASLSPISIDVKTRNFVDSAGRTHIFHGMNAVYKIAPWFPATTGFDSTTTLSRIDAKNLKSWGFNLVRLGVMWPGVEPTQGHYNSTYLDEINTIVDNLAEEGIYVILDFHQDIWHRKFCGEGVPDYVYELCKSSEPEGMVPFPQPAVNASYPLDEDGNPTLEACLSRSFITYYFSAEVGAGFQCLYDNQHGLWDAFAGYWVQVATRFGKKASVLGYELINEPWAGDVINSPKNLLPKYAEKKFLQPMYQHLHAAIRTVDTEKIIFFEGLTIDYWQNGFTEGPGGAEYNDRQALAYHIYCPQSNHTSLKVEGVCKAMNREFLDMRRRDAERLGTGMIMTEFGASEDTTGDLIDLHDVLTLADHFMQSWAYWQFKYYQDITTMTPQGESMYDADGSVDQDKLEALSRTYPHVTAGQLQEFSFDTRTAAFTMAFQALSDVAAVGGDDDETRRTTLVYANFPLFYKHGASVSVTLTGDAASTSSSSASSSFAVVCPADEGYLVKIVQTAAVSADAAGVRVDIVPCGVRGEDAVQCTCPRKA